MDIFESLQTSGEKEVLRLASSSIHNNVCSIMDKELVIEEGTNSSASGNSNNRVIGQLQRRSYEQSFISAIAPINIKGLPGGILLSLASEYGGADGVEDEAKKTVRFFLNPALEATAGDELTTDAGVKVKVLYTEKDNPNMIVEYVEDGKEAEQWDKLNGSEIELINSAEFGVGQLFANYGGVLETLKGESLDTLDTINLKINSISVKPKTSKIRTNFTEEYVEDFSAALAQGKRTSVSMRTILRDLITINIEQQYLEFGKVYATVRPKLTLREGKGAQISLARAYTDILSNINLAIGEIGTDTRTSSNYWVAGSSNVVAALRTIGAILPKPAKYAKMNKVVGILKGSVSIVVEDSYSLNDYFMVGLASDNSIDFPSITYIPYSTVFIEATDVGTFHKTLGIMNRIILEQNGMDSKGKKNGESLQVCEVDMTGLPNQSLR